MAVLAAANGMPPLAFFMPPRFQVAGLRILSRCCIPSLTLVMIDPTKLDGVLVGAAITK
jgi:hypothetical protein